MQSTIEMTEGRARLDSIIAAFPDGSEFWNEAQNRFQFVDRLLLECLGWDQPHIEVEARDEGGGKSDYLLGKPVRAALEAKKEAVWFDFLPGTRPNAVRKLRPLVEASKPLADAINQVLPYCIQHGAQIAIVCNGPQLVLFQAMTPGQSPLDGEAFVFNGFRDYSAHFALLWKLLSPEGIFENRALRDLALHRNPKIPPKAITAIPEATGFRYRSEFQENLRALGEILLDDIDDNPDVREDFYRECYVPLDANNRHLLLSKNIIASRYQRLSDNGSVPAKAGAKIVNGRLHVDQSLQAGPQAARPIVVIGDVGVGKTSFFENLYESLSAQQKLQTYYVHINLGEKATLSQDVKTHVLTEVPRVLQSGYGVSIFDSKFVEELYQEELVGFDDSVPGQYKGVDEAKYISERIAFLRGKVKNADEHLRSSLSFLATKKRKQILLVIDNADQRKFEVQQEAFLIAQELAATRAVLVFVALRPSTFYQSKLTGALSGYQKRLLTISPPPADEVIRKRIGFALRVAEGKAAPAALRGVELNLGNIALFLTAVLRSIRGNSSIRLFLGNITGGNIRLVIEMISTFCGSPNIDAQRIVEIERTEGAYSVPLHEFSKHALLGEHAYFNAISSNVACNLFDVSTADQREHFIACLIIAYVGSPMGIKDNDGYVSGGDILREMMKQGFVEDQIRFSLRRLAAKRLIETPHGHYRELAVDDATPPDSFYFRATSIGLYHIRQWVGDFAFLDATSIDTPVFNTAARGQIFELAASHEIRDRFNKATRFRRYLEEAWREANFSANYYDLGSAMSVANSTFEAVDRFIREGPRKRRKT